MYALTCTTPRLTNAGPKFRITDRTPGVSSKGESARAACPNTPSTAGSCTTNWSALPATDPAARITASRSSGRPAGPKSSSVAIIAAFQITGAVYEMKNLRWLFRTPRHHAEMTSRPAPGNRIRTSRVVSSRFGPLKPGAITSMNTGARATPARTRTAVTRDRMMKTVRATRSACSCSPRASSPAYTGMKDADRAPSPKRF